MRWSPPATTPSLILLDGGHVMAPNTDRFETWVSAIVEAANGVADTGAVSLSDPVRARGLNQNSCAWPAGGVRLIAVHGL